MLRHQHEWTESLFEAQLAESAGLYDDMLAKVLDMAKKETFGVHEHSVLAEAIQKSLKGTREAIRNLEQMHAFVEKKSKSSEMKAIEEYKQQLVTELNDRCDEIIAVLGNDLKGSAVSPVEKALVYKGLADTHRYKAEFSPCKDDHDHIKNLYEKAGEFADAEGESSVSLLVSIRLNCAIFIYEVMNDKDEAIDIMKDLDKFVTRNRKTDTLAGRLVQHNLRLWKKGEGKVYQCKP
ncbi:MAG: uncharacterized protein KVP18_004688 [Porospora cf. gigantea A]|uniref:uncharacterized protein n=1 Tax=Porospora cf. gigantea A TaxID=2853593 RepID=UPI003559F569|nr:MAG: hypothetical protein KVP18_004688 [Porospora cf. gigantea A]